MEQENKKRYDREGDQDRQRSGDNQQRRFQDYDPYGNTPGGYGQVNYNNEDERDHFRNPGGDRNNQYGDSFYGQGDQQQYASNQGWGNRDSGPYQSGQQQRQQQHGGQQNSYGQQGRNDQQNQQGRASDRPYSDTQYGGGYAQGRQFEPYNVQQGNFGGQSGRQQQWPQDQGYQQYGNQQQAGYGQQRSGGQQGGQRWEDQLQGRMKREQQGNQGGQRPYSQQGNQQHRFDDQGSQQGANGQSGGQSRFDPEWKAYGQGNQQGYGGSSPWQQDYQAGQRRNPEWDQQRRSWQEGNQQEQYGYNRQVYARMQQEHRPGDAPRYGQVYRDQHGDHGHRREQDQPEMYDRRDWLNRTADKISSWFGGRDDDHDRDRRREGSHRGKGPKEYNRSGDRIREDVCDRLADDDHLDASDIEVKVEGSEVVLNGTVRSREDKRRAEDLAESISGIKHVQNNLRVSKEVASIGGTSIRQHHTGEEGDDKDKKKGGWL